ncbi:MAG TPA: glycosyltransferase [Bacteroidota bacterium]|nr:glycosyltransferase [Bacteroidota bacterium]
MHIVQCLSNSTHGGAQQVVYLLVMTLQKLRPDLRQSVVLPEGGVYGERFRSLGINAYHVPLNKISPAVSHEVRNLFRSIGPTVVHTHGKGAGLYGRRARRGEFQYRTIHSFHGIHPPNGHIRKLMYLRLERSLAHDTDAVVGVSRSEADEITAAIPRLDGKITVIPNIVDLPAVVRASEGEVPTDIRSILDTNTGSFVITMIGRDDPLKNYPLAFSTAALVMKRVEQAVFVFVGGNPESRDGRDLLSKYPERTLIVPHLENTAPLIRRTNVILLTSRKEGAPISLLEGFALGVPAVGTNVPGIQDSISDRNNGILCDENPEALSAALESVIRDSSLYARLRNGASETAKKFDVQAWALNYARIYGLEGG